jgi:ATP-dependent exoDNAse (exonuclease V) alpha subunit
LSLWAGSSERFFESDYDGEVYNGDLGIVSGIDMEVGELSVDFDGRDISYGFGELDELVLAYATTIHKSQGSEYPAVVIRLTTQHYPMHRGEQSCCGPRSRSGSSAEYVVALCS